MSDPNQRVQFGTSGHRGTSLERHVHRGPHPGDHPGHLRLPPRPGDRRPALPGQGHARPVRPGPAHGPRSPGRQRRRDDPPARRRRDADARDLARHPRLQPRPHRPPRATASSSRRRTTRPRTAASSTTRPTAAPPTPTSPRGSRTAPTPCCASGNAERQAHAVRRGDPARARPSEVDFVKPYVNDLAQRHRHGGDPRRRPQAGRRPAGRRRRALLAADRRHLRPEHHRHQPGGRPDVPAS